VIEFVLAGAKTAYPATGKNAFLENPEVRHQSLQRRATGEPGEASANDGD
jgi:hypothetical protein